MVLLLSYCSLPQRTEKKYRVLSNFSTTVSYVICVIPMHYRQCFTGKRGLDGNDLLYK